METGGFAHGLEELLFERHDVTTEKFMLPWPAGGERPGGEAKR
jgi:hypothetical protein